MSVALGSDHRRIRSTEGAALCCSPNQCRPYRALFPTRITNPARCPHRTTHLPGVVRGFDINQAAAPSGLPGLGSEDGQLKTHVKDAQPHPPRADGGQDQNAGTVFTIQGPADASSHSLSKCSYAGWVEVDSCRDEVAEEDPASCLAGSLRSLRA